MKTTKAGFTFQNCALNTCLYNDATFNNLHNGNNQSCLIVFLRDQDDFSALISLSSNKLKSAVRSTLAAETLAFS